MNKYFPERYGRVRPSPTREILELRWTGVEHLTSALKPADIVPLVLLARSAPSTEGEEKARATFVSADVNFPMRDNSEEIRVLAIEAIIKSIDDRLAAADSLALAMLSSEFLGLVDPDPLLSDALETARNHVERRQLEMRRPNAFPEGPPVTLPAALKAFGESVPADSQVLNSQGFRALFEASVSDLQQIRKYTQQSASVLRHQQMLTSEISALTLLYVTRYSETFRRPLAELNAERPIAVALELARVTQFEAGTAYDKRLRYSAASRRVKERGYYRRDCGSRMAGRSAITE